MRNPQGIKVANFFIQNLFKTITTVVGSGILAFLVMFLGRYPLFFLEVSPELAFILAVGTVLVLISGAIYVNYKLVIGTQVVKIITSIVAAIFISVAVFFASLWGLFFGFS